MASGQTLVPIYPTEALSTAPLSAWASPDTRNGHDVLDFDGNTDEEIVFKFLLPREYAGGGLDIVLTVGFSSATSGSSRWQADIERCNTDLDADSFTGTFQSVGITPSATSGITTTGTIAFTNGAQMDSLAAGEWGRLKIRRDADGTSGTDDIATDAELFGIEIKEH